MNTPTSRPPRRMPGPLRLLVVAFAVVVVLALAAWAALVIAFPPAKLRAMVQDQLRQTLRREVRFADVGISIWPPVRLAVTDPALAEPGGFAAGTAFRARAIHLDLDLWALFAHAVVVRRLEIVAPFTHLVLRPDGGTNFDGLVAPPPPGAAGKPTASGAPFDLVVRELRIRDGRFQVDAQKARTRVVFALDSRLSFAAESGGARIHTAGDWKISDLAFGPDTVARLAHLNRSFAPLTWKLAHAGGFDAASHRLMLDRLALEFGRTAIGLSGTVDNPGPAAELDLRARGERLDLGEILGFLSAAHLPALRGVRGSGGARFDLAVTGGGGAGRAPDVAGTLAVDGVSVESPRLPKKVESVNGMIAFSPASARVQGLTARAGQSSFRFEGTVARPLAVLAPAGQVAPADVRFKLTSPYLDLAELLPPGPSSASHFNARGGGEVAIDRLKNQKLDVRNVRAQVGLAPDVVEVPSFTLDGYGGQVKGSARFGVENPAKPTFAIKGEADSVRAGQFLGAWTKAADLLDGAVNANFDLNGAGGQPAQILSSLTAVGLAAVSQGRLGGPALEAIAKATGIARLRNPTFKDMHLPFRIERGRVVTDPVRIAGADGEWRLTGGIGFDGSLDYAVSLTLPADVTARSGAAGALAAVGLTDAQGRTLIDLLVSGNARAPRIAIDSRTMQARLAGRASQALEEQRAKLARDLLQRATGTPDSAGAPPADAKQTEKDLKKKANELLEGLFGKKRPPPAPASTSTPAESAARDTTRR